MDQTRKRLQALWKQNQPNYALFMSLVKEEFNWTTQEAYIATDFLFREHGMN